MILTILITTVILLIYYFDVISTLCILPDRFKTKQEFLNNLIPFRFWKGKIKLFKNYNNLPSAKEK